MVYENPDVPHHVNVSRDNHVTEFIRLGAGLALLIAIISSAVYFGGGRLARLIPFETEKSWVGDKVIGLELKTCGDNAPRIESYLTRIGSELGEKMELPPGMTIKVHYTNLDVPNAFATLGGHIVVTSGLYRRMPSENALAMVIGHEIGHVKSRDPLSALGGSAAMTVTLALLTGDGDALGSQLAQVVQRGYSRQAERKADEAAIVGLMHRYGHAGGGAALFQVLADYKGETSKAIPTLLSTHPGDDERIARLEAAAATWQPAQVPLLPVEVPPDTGSSCSADT